MTIHRAQLAESQRPAFPPLRALLGSAESVLANQAVQTPSLQMNANKFWENVFQGNLNVLMGSAAPVFCSSPQGLPNSSPSVANQMVGGALGKGLSAFGLVQEANFSQWRDFVWSYVITCTREDAQLAFEFPRADAHTHLSAGHSPENTGAESVEMLWLVKNAPELAKYKGQWLLIQGHHLVMHTDDFRIIRDLVRERGIRSPFVYYVPTDQESNAVSI